MSGEGLTGVIQFQFGQGFGQGVVNGCIFGFFLLAQEGGNFLFRHPLAPFFAFTSHKNMVFFPITAAADKNAAIPLAPQLQLFFAFRAMGIGHKGQRLTVAAFPVLAHQKLDGACHLSDSSIRGNGPP